MSSPKLSRFLAAVAKDDLKNVKFLQSSNPGVFDAIAAPQVQPWMSGDNNPLMVACVNGSIGVARLLAGQNPELAKAKNSDGYTPLHVACKERNLNIVNILLEIDRNFKLCLIKDKFSMIPIQTAIVNGFDEAIKPLIEACPESVWKVTAQKETLLHLAAKHHQPKACAVLLEEYKKRSLQHLLYRKDRQGNNVLHIATSNKLVEIVKLLLDHNNGTIFSRVNSWNKRGRTALDLYSEYSSHDISTGEIGKTLIQAGAVLARSLPLKGRLRWHMETKNVMLVVLGLVFAASFTTVCNLPASFHDHDKHVSGATFSHQQLISGHLPPIFYLMIFNTAIHIACMLAIVALLWSVDQYRQVVLFVTTTTAIVYGILVNEVMPKFFVRVDRSHHIFNSRLLVWFVAVAYICFGAMAYHIIRFGFLCIRGFGFFNAPFI